MRKTHYYGYNPPNMLKLEKLFRLVEVFCILVASWYFIRLHSSQLSLYNLSLHESSVRIESAFNRAISNAEIIIKYIAEVIIQEKCDKEKIDTYISLFNSQPHLKILLEWGRIEWVEAEKLAAMQDLFPHLNLLGAESPAAFQKLSHNVSYTKQSVAAANSQHSDLQFGVLQNKGNRTYVPVFYCVKYQKGYCHSGLYTEFDFSHFSEILINSKSNYYDKIKFAIVARNGQILAESADKYISKQRFEMVQKYLQGRQLNKHFREYTALSPFTTLGFGEGVKIKKITGYPYYIATMIPNQFAYNQSLSETINKNLSDVLLIVAVFFVISIFARYFALYPIIELGRLAASISRGGKNVKIKNYRAQELQSIANSLHKVIDQKYQLVEAQARQDFVIKQLEAANNAKSQFIRRIQHVLRTPLNHIIGSADILVKRLTEASKDTLEYVQIISHAGHELLNTINNIITANDAEIGIMRLEESECELINILNNSIANVQPYMLPNNITIDLHLAHDVPKVLIDASKITLALQNLIRNAVIYNKPQGQVKISVKRLAKGVVIIIADTGNGMSEEEISDINSASKSISTIGNSSNSLGLGLTIVRNIIQLHDMKMEIDSKQAEGSEIRLIIPNIRLLAK